MPENRLTTEPDLEAKDQNKNETGGGASFIQSWLPLIVTILLMPVLAYVTTNYMIIPKLEKTLGVSPQSAEGAESGKDAGESGDKGVNLKNKQTFQLNKILVNVAGSVGTRYLLGSYTLVGTAPDFKSKIEANKDQLLDIAASIMSTKTISDLEKPGARNLIRNELISAFNNALGANLIKEIYITEFAIQ